MSQTSKKSVLIVGVGSIGHRHLRCFTRTGRAKLSICETNVPLREQIAAQYGVERTYTHLGDALADRPDCAVITTPAHLHVPMAQRLAEAGVHVLIEKPLSTSLDGLDRLAATIASGNITAVVAYVLRAHPVFQSMQAAITSGRFGAPVQLTATCGQHFPTYRPAYREIYYNNRATGGGAVQDALTHILNLGQWLIGPADRVLADVAHQMLEGVEVEDTVHLLSRHGQAMASFALNQYQAPNEATITVVCREGTARYEAHRQRWRWTTVPDEPWHDEQGLPLERDDLFVRQAEAFLDAVEGRRAPLCTLAEAVHTLRINLSALASAEQGVWQTIAKELP